MPKIIIKIVKNFLQDPSLTLRGLEKIIKSFTKPKLESGGPNGTNG